MVIGNIPERALLRYLGYQAAAYLLTLLLDWFGRQIRKRVLVYLRTLLIILPYRDGGWEISTILIV